MTTAPRSRHERELALLRRQQALLRRSDALRADLARQVQPLQAPLALADRARAGWQWLRARPQVPLAALATVAVLRPRRAWRLGLRLWWGWRRWQGLQRWLRAG